MKVRTVVALLPLLLVALGARADWTLDGERSALNFISIKNSAIAETHRFGGLSGTVTADGVGTLTIDLASVDTLIPIRDERMREMLFETANHPQATATTRVDPAVLAAAGAGGSMATELALKLELHGVTGALTVPVTVVGEPDGGIRVVTSRAVVVSAADFGLEAGVEALRAVAGLKTISTAVPVTVNLVFAPAR